jgi:hypothetical protein
MSSPKSPQTQILGEQHEVGKQMRARLAAQGGIAHMEPQAPLNTAFRRRFSRAVLQPAKIS